MGSVTSVIVRDSPHVIVILYKPRFKSVGAIVDFKKNQVFIAENSTLIWTILWHNNVNLNLQHLI